MRFFRYALAGSCLYSLVFSHVTRINRRRPYSVSLARRFIFLSCIFWDLVHQLLFFCSLLHLQTCSLPWLPLFYIRMCASLLSPWAFAQPCLLCPSPVFLSLLHLLTYCCQPSVPVKPRPAKASNDLVTDFNRNRLVSSSASLIHSVNFAESLLCDRHNSRY